MRNRMPTASLPRAKSPKRFSAAIFETVEGRRLLSVSARPVRNAIDALKLATPGVEQSPSTPAKLTTSAKGASTTKATSTQVKTATRPPASGDLTTPGSRPLALEAEALSGGGVRISWPALGLDSTGEIVVFRKPLAADLWDEEAIGVPGWNATQFTDTTAVTGIGYEYKVVVYTTLGAAPYEKYVYAGNQVAPVTDRGSVLLVVDETQLDATRDGAGTTLAPALQKYKADLIADGYRVFQITAPRVDVPRTRPPAVDPENPTPEEIAAHSATWFNAVKALKAQIRSVWQAVPDLKSVFLIGHVPVPYSGLISPDVTIGHEQSLGAWPADAFYSTLSTPDDLWTDYVEMGTTDAHINLIGDGKFDQDSLNQLGYGTELENKVFADVVVGRVDFAMLDTFTGVAQSVGAKATVGETNLIARYLERVHEFKTDQWDVRQKALFEEAFPFGEYYDPNRLAPNVGINNVEFGTVSPTEPTNWDGPYPPGTSPTDYGLNNHSWMWMYTGAGGFPSRTTMQFSPNRQLRSDQYSNGVWASPTDFTKINHFGSHKSVFNFVYASYVGDWDYRNNLLRSIIAEPDGYGLVALWGSRPVWDQHHMGLGETLATSALKTWNNFGERQAYFFDPNSSSTRQSVLGDPTLRQEHVKPATNARVDFWSAAGNRVRWDASADPAVSGYYVYRASSIDGAYTLLNSMPVTGTTYIDSTATSPAGMYYMVRAAKLETSSSGTYWNLALGAYSAPVVTGNFFNSGGKPHTIDITFSQDVGASLATGDFAISGNRYDLPTRTMVPKTFVAGVDFHLASYNPATRVARLVFDSSNEIGVAQIMTSGRYTLTIGSGAVTNAFGASVNSGYSFGLAFLAGDSNGDLAVTFDDLLAVAQRYNTSVGSNPFANGDFNADGVVNFDDLLILAQYYGVSI